MITKEILEQMRAQQPKLKPVQQYTPDNAAYAHIGHQLQTQREKDIKVAERAMRDAQRDMRREYELSRHRGQAKTHFKLTNHHKAKKTQEMTP